MSCVCFFFLREVEVEKRKDEIADFFLLDLMCRFLWSRHLLLLLFVLQYFEEEKRFLTHSKEKERREEREKNEETNGFVG